MKTRFVQRLPSVVPVALVGAVLAGALASSVRTQGRMGFLESFEHPAIAYSTARLDDPVSALARALEDGSARLSLDGRSGYLRSLLRALDVPTESQLVVFSQGSLQGPQISPETPRAVFFNDRVAVGWVPGGLLEIASQDPRQGTIFYRLDPAGPPRFERSRECLQCHVTWETFGVPGLLVLNTIPPVDADGYTSGGIVDHRFPLEERWGGWYVTGDLGRNRHFGNGALRAAASAREAIATDPLASLDGLFDLSGYPSVHSDVVALMVLEHQTRMSNLITYLGWETRVAAAEQATPRGMAFERGAARPVPPRVRAAARELVDYMLFVDEAPLADAIRGSSGFTERFSAQGPHDRKGRSLRELDLTRRLMRYPCSYMIHSPAFDALPDLAKAEIYARLGEVLSGADRDERYESLSAADRRAILEILADTKPDLPASFPKP